MEHQEHLHVFFPKLVTVAENCENLISIKPRISAYSQGLKFNKALHWTNSYWNSCAAYIVGGWLNHWVDSTEI